MAKILILGAGAMGSAFSVSSLERRHEVIIAGTHLEDAFIDEIKNNNNFHPSLKLNLSEKTNIIKYMNLSEELKKNPDLIVLGVNSKGINWVVDQLSDILNDSTLPPILMLTKGFREKIIQKIIVPNTTLINFFINYLSIFINIIFLDIICFILMSK